MSTKTKEEIKKEVWDKLVKKSYPEKPFGGQHAGVTSGVSLYSEDLGVEINIETSRSQYKNLQLATTLMDLAIDEVLSNNGRL
jgi:hypothetical protein